MQLKEYLEKKGITQQDAAYEAGTSIKTMCQIMGYNVIPHTATMRKLSAWSKNAVAEKDWQEYCNLVLKKRARARK